MWPRSGRYQTEVAIFTIKFEFLLPNTPTRPPHQTLSFFKWCDTSHDCVMNLALYMLTCALPMLLLCPTHEYKTRVVQVTTFTVILFVLAYTALVAEYALHFDKEAQHTSRLSGEHWVQELLDSHEDRIYNELGMHKNVFNRLLAVLGQDAGLHGMRHVSAKEQLAIFLHYMHRGLSNRTLQKHFQRSADTISKYVSLHLLIVIRTNAYLNLYLQFSMCSL